MKPIIQSFYDTDWYKLLMLQFIWKHHKKDEVTFKFTNRSKHIKLAHCFSPEDLIEQLDHCYNLRPAGDVESCNILLWILEQFPDMFEPDFILFLMHEFTLSKYDLTQTDDGQYDLYFEGDYVSTTMWEIYALSIVNELRVRKQLEINVFAEDDDIRERMCDKLELKLFKIAESTVPIMFSDFSTRRRFSFKHQKDACRLALDICNDSFVGSSNIYISYLLKKKPIGTNAHELPMVETALEAAKASVMRRLSSEDLKWTLMRRLSSEDLKWTQYHVLDMWADMYPNYKIMLPDTYGTLQFLKGAPVDLATEWDGIRVDSMKPELAAGAILSWYHRHNVDPTTKTIIFSDGLDVDDILRLAELTNGVFGKVLFGWGTLFGNDTRGCTPDPRINIDPISIVCKVDRVNGTPAVKLSDNYNKAMGEPEEVEQYKRIFGNHKLATQKVIV